MVKAAAAAASLELLVLATFARHRPISTSCCSPRTCCSDRGGCRIAGDLVVRAWSHRSRVELLLHIHEQWILMGQPFSRSNSESDRLAHPSSQEDLRVKEGPHQIPPCLKPGRRSLGHLVHDRCEHLQRLRKQTQNQSYRSQPSWTAASKQKNGGRTW